MFIDTVKKLLQEKNISVNKMAQDLHFGTGTFRTWETRGTVPDGETLLKIARYFGVTVDYLLGNEAKEKGATQMVAPITELSPREVQVALAYRSQDDAVKAAIDKMLDLPPLVEEGLA